MGSILFLLFTPLITAVLFLLIREPRIQRILAILTAILLSGCAIFMLYTYFHQPDTYYLVHSDRLNQIIMVVEGAMALYQIWVAIRWRKPVIAVFAVIQIVSLLWFELSGNHSSGEMDHHLFIDKLTLLMIAIISIVGSVICVYAIPYMEKHHEHHPEQKNRSPYFMALLYIFLSAMYGLVLCNDLIWIYFFWEVTTLCSYLLIRYPDSAEAHQNACLALVLNLLGGVCFVGGIIYLGVKLDMTELHDILSQSDYSRMIIPAVLLAIAGLTKSAQLPFSKWLLGAMVAPTPSSALLHSSTMVKAGVYLLIRISPLMVGNGAGTMVIVIGGLTFLLASLLAITQSDGKKVLAYSTIANLGLIVICTGVGTYESLWAAVMLILFHAVSKSLLFLTVGSVEQVTGSRDIEDMHGLTVKLPALGLIMAIGIAGMFLAPFGMLISKWAALRAFVDSGHLFVVLFLVFGSAATLMYWSKWLGKIITVLHRSERIRNQVNRIEYASLFSLAGLVVLLCVTFPQVSHVLVEPFLQDLFPGQSVTIISAGNQIIMLLMLGMIAFMPFGAQLFASMDEKVTSVYMSGINRGNNRFFTDSMGQDKRVHLSNWYLDRYLGEKKLLVPSLWLTGILLVVIALLTIGGQIWG